MKMQYETPKMELEEVADIIATSDAQDGHKVTDPDW